MLISPPMRVKVPASWYSIKLFSRLNWSWVLRGAKQVGKRNSEKVVR